MRARNKKTSVFDFDDYREFLREWYKNSKAENASFSYRAFAKRAGLSSTNFFMLVMQGKRNLTEESEKKIATGLRLNKQEREFFRNLVFFNQAKTHDDKNFYYRLILQSRKYRQLKPIEKQCYAYYSNWYHPIVRELVVALGFDGTPEWVSKRIFPSITPAEAARSIELLEELGFIEKTADGKWKQSSTIISTGSQVNSVIVQNYHSEIFDLSKFAMSKLPPEERDISSLTLGIKKEQMDELMTKIREFRQEILKTFATCTEPTEVVQLNIQLYPVTKDETKEKRP